LCSISCGRTAAQLAKVDLRDRVGNVLRREHVPLRRRQRALHLELEHLAQRLGAQLAQRSRESTRRQPQLAHRQSAPLAQQVAAGAQSPLVGGRRRRRDRLYQQLRRNSAASCDR
jgi:hypothetical protein